MFTAELVKPARLTIAGTLYLRGKPVAVDRATAFALSGNDRFKVTGLTPKDAEEAAAETQRPVGDALMEAIRDAEGGIDIDLPSSLDADEKVSVEALSEALGFPITVQERDRALYANVTKKVGRLDAADAKEPAKKIVLKKAAPAAAPSGGDPTTQGAISA